MLKSSFYFTYSSLFVSFREKKNVKIAAIIAVKWAFFLFLPPDFSYKIVSNWPPVSKIELFFKKIIFVSNYNPPELNT